MQKIFFIIVLFLSPITLAEVNLKKFSIEGISIGDSVANYFPGREITKNIVKQPDLTDEFYVAHFNKHKSFSKFDQIYFVINPSTENVLFSIEGMSAFIDFKQDIQKCFDVPLQDMIRLEQALPEKNELANSCFFTYTLNFHLCDAVPLAFACFYVMRLISTMLYVL